MPRENRCPERKSLFLATGPLFLRKWPLDFFYFFFKSFLLPCFFWHDMAFMRGYNSMVFHFSPPPPTVSTTVPTVQCPLFIVFVVDAQKVQTPDGPPNTRWSTTCVWHVIYYVLFMTCTWKSHTHTHQLETQRLCSHCLPVKECFYM